MERARGHRALRYLALGDSYTIGTGASDDAQAWPSIIASRLGAELTNPAVNGYTTLDLSLTWRPRPHVELELVGRNLLDDRHPEWGAETTRHEVERAGMLRATWTF